MILTSILEVILKQDDAYKVLRFTYNINLKGIFGRRSGDIFLLFVNGSPEMDLNTRCNQGQSLMG